MLVWARGRKDAAAGQGWRCACALCGNIVRRTHHPGMSLADSECVRGKPLELCSPPCVPRRASRPAHFLRQCVGRASKLECCMLAIVVFHHLLTPRLVGCDGAARRSRQRDRPFRHSCTIVPTPCIGTVIQRLENSRQGHLTPIGPCWFPW